MKVTLPILQSILRKLRKRANICSTNVCLSFCFLRRVSHSLRLYSLAGRESRSRAHLIHLGEEREEPLPALKLCLSIVKAGSPPRLGPRGEAMPLTSPFSTHNFLEFCRYFGRLILSFSPFFPAQ